MPPGDSLTDHFPPWWQTMDSAPRYMPVLLWGRLTGPNLTDIHPKGLMRVVGYWDEIDEAWALTCTTSQGPFFEPFMWAHILEPPSNRDHPEGFIEPCDVCDGTVEAYDHVAGCPGRRSNQTEAA